MGTSLIKCSGCGLSKPEDDFSWRSKARNIRHPRCKVCHRESVRRHYNKNVPYYVAKAKRRRPKEKAQRDAIVARMKLSCAHCGIDNPIVLEFHHLDPSKKEKAIAVIAISKIKVEAAKCIILCANCHRIEHWNIRNAPVAQPDSAPGYEPGGSREGVGSSSLPRCSNQGAPLGRGQAF